MPVSKKTDTGWKAALPARCHLYLGQLMEDVGRLTRTVVEGLEDGTLTQAEQKDIKEAIKKTEQSIVQLKKRIGEEVEK